MTSSVRGRLGVWGASAALAAALVTPMLTSSPAQASAPRVGIVPAAGAGVACLTGADRPKPPKDRSLRDTTAVDVALARSVQRAIEPGLKKVLAQGRTTTASAARLPRSVWIPVYYHVIRGTHTHEAWFGTPRVQLLNRILNYGYLGTQSDSGILTRFRFALRRVDYHRNDNWYHAAPLSYYDREMKRKLHVGHGGSLNVYINGMASPDGTGQLLGFARFPWQYAVNPPQDAVTIHAETLPGGWFQGYNQGDTLIHEVGHWLGAFHTFENGCNHPGDSVDDTPYEGEPASGCPGGADSCPLRAGTDPIHNFMDYAVDACMDEFTRGQANRMDAAFDKWRYPYN